MSVCLIYALTQSLSRREKWFYRPRLQREQPFVLFAEKSAKANTVATSERYETCQFVTKQLIYTWKPNVFCRNKHCKRVVFCQQSDNFQPYGRLTKRATELLSRMLSKKLPWIIPLNKLCSSFSELLKSGNKSKLDKWLSEAEELNIKRLNRFVFGIRKVYSTVFNALQIFIKQWNCRRKYKPLKNHQATNVWMSRTWNSQTKSHTIIVWLTIFTKFDEKPVILGQGTKNTIENFAPNYLRKLNTRRNSGFFVRRCKNVSYIRELFMDKQSEELQAIVSKISKHNTCNKNMNQFRANL